MKLKIVLPTRILFEAETASVTAPGWNGSFGLLPRHIDFVTALAPGLLSYRRSPEADEEFIAVDRGTLVKQGSEVRVSVRNAVSDVPLEELAEVVDSQFAELDEHERKVQSAVARLQADFLRRFMQT